MVLQKPPKKDTDGPVYIILAVYHSSYIIWDIVICISFLKGNGIVKHTHLYS